VEAVPEPPPVAAKPEPPRPTVRTDVFQQTKRDAEPPQTPRKKMRTGSFAQAEVETDRRPPRPRSRAQVGGFEVDAARPVATPPTDDRVVNPATFGDRVTDAAPRPASPRSGTVRSTSFTDKVPVDAPGAPNGNRGDVKQGQFGDRVIVSAPARPREQPAANPDKPVEIVSKEKPAYTDEARRMKVEGEVVLEVIFVATGQLRVVRVLESLGHGLDEAAVEAAEQILFKPAQRDGKAVDYTAVVRIVFQLA
jgi:TonB family protein